MKLHKLCCLITAFALAWMLVPAQALAALGEVAAAGVETESAATDEAQAGEPGVDDASEAQPEDGQEEAGASGGAAAADADSEAGAGSTDGAGDADGAQTADEAAKDEVPLSAQVNGSSFSANRGAPAKAGAVTDDWLDGLQFGSRTDPTSDKYVAYAVEPEFDPEVREYTRYVPDTVSGVYARGISVLGSGASSGGYYDPFAIYTDVNGRDQRINLANLASTNKLVYLDDLIKRGAVTNDMVIHSYAGTADYIVHVRRIVSLSSLVVQSGTTQSELFDPDSTEYDLAVSLNSESEKLVITPKAYSYPARVPNTAYTIKVDGNEVKTGEAYEHVLSGGEETLEVEVSWEGNRSTVYTVHVRPADAGGSARFTLVGEEPDSCTVKLFNSHGTRLSSDEADPMLFTNLFAGSTYTWTASSPGWRSLSGTFEAAKGETAVELAFSERTKGKYLDELWAYPNSSGAVSGNYPLVREESLDEQFDATVYTVTYSSQLTSQSCYLAAMLSDSAPEGAKIKVKAYGLDGERHEITLPDSEPGQPIRRNFPVKIFDVGVKRAIYTIEAGKGDDIDRYVILVKRDLQLKSLFARTPDGASVLEADFKRSVHDYDAGVRHDIDTLQVGAEPFPGLEDIDLTIDGRLLGESEYLEVKLTEQYAQDICVKLSQEDSYADPDYAHLSYESTGLYTIHVERLYPVSVSFEVTPEDAVVSVYDHLGKRTESVEGDNKRYEGVYRGRRYTYTVTRNGCKGVKGEFTAEENLVISVDLNGASTTHPEVSGMEWWNYRNNVENNGVTASTTPDSADIASLKWQVSLGLDYNSSCTPPIVGGGHVFTAAGKYVYELDKKTGKVISVSDELVGDAAFALNSMTYAEGMLFVQVGRGRIQALSATTLKSLWVSEKIGGQTLSPISYRDGYIYSGTWNSETKAGEYFCISVTDEDPDSDSEEKLTSWRYSHTGGFYWAGAYVNDACLVFGSDDGEREGDNANTAVLYSVDPKTGVCLDKKSNIVGDIRSSIVFDSGYLYFVTKSGALYRVALQDDGRFGSVDTFDLGGSATGSPVVHKGRVYVGVCGQGGQFDADGGHNFAVVNSGASGLKLAYRVETPGFPQAAALASTGYEEKDYDSDGRPDGRVYVYFTCNARPGGIYMLTDEPNASDGEMVTLYEPDTAQQQYCISPLCCDGEGTLYYKNDSGYLFAVSANDAYLLDAELTPDAGTAFWDEEFEPGLLGYLVMVGNEATSVSLKLKVSTGRKVTVNGKEYKPGMTLRLPEDKSPMRIELAVSYRGKQRAYTLDVEPRGTDPSLSELFAGTSNNALQLARRLALTPEFDPEVLEYEAAEAAHDARFVNLWAVPTGRYSEVELEGVSGVSKINVFRNAIGSYGRTRYAVYFGESEARATVNVNVTAGDGKTKRTYTVVLTRPDVYAPRVDDAVGHRLSQDDAAVLFDTNEAGRYCYVVTADAENVPERPGADAEVELVPGKNRIELVGFGPDAGCVWIWTVDEHGNRSEQPTRVDVSAWKQFETTVSVKPADATVTLVDAAGEPVEIRGTGASRTVTLVEGNVYTIDATREGHAQYTDRLKADSTQTELKVELVNLRSTDSSLKGLFVSSSSKWKAGIQKLAPEFSAKTTRYAATYPGERSHLNVWAQVNDPKASVTVYAMSGVHTKHVNEDETIAVSKADGHPYWKVYFADGVYEAQVRMHVVAEDKTTTDYYVDLSIKDVTPPELGKVSASRIAKDKASVVFKADETGHYWYTVAKKGDKKPKVNCTGSGTKMLAGTTTITVSGLEDGAYVVYVKAQDLYGNESKQISIPVPAQKKHASKKPEKSKKQDKEKTKAAASSKKSKKHSGGSGTTGGSGGGVVRRSYTVTTRSNAGAQRSSQHETHSAKSTKQVVEKAQARSALSDAAPQTPSLERGQRDSRSGAERFSAALQQMPWWAKGLLIFAGLGLLYLLFYLFSVLKRRREVAIAMTGGKKPTPRRRA